MEQIYYTQCPIGYGLGASNGFQIKRRTAGHPVSGDFRHLGTRAFVSGTRALAPATLRYRRDGAIAEIAWLTPRAREYQTERGEWGRPGGHFAHGLRLSNDEMLAIARWPAGLFDRPFWKRADPEPSRGKPPDTFTLGHEDLICSPTFESVAALAEGFDVDRLARLLTTLALAASEGRTLFLIDAPERLGARVALLTFAFPEALRPTLTFSTYHDRPEELPGYRLQGTIASARPNRAMLTSLGFIADIAARTIEPKVEPSRWASTLAGWFVRRGREDAEAWSDACLKRADKALPEAIETAWSDDWLNHLFEFHTHTRVFVISPASAAEWAILSDFAGWSGRVGLGAEWSSARGSGWWNETLKTVGASKEGRDALLAQLALAEAWRGVEPTIWSAVAAPWLEAAEPTERQGAIVAFVRSAPGEAQPRVLSALVRAFSPRVGDAVLEWLKNNKGVDRGMLLPLEVRGAIAHLREDRSIEPLRDILSRVIRLPATIPAVLDALAGESSAISSESRARSNEALAEFFDDADRLGRSEPIAWASRREDASVWLEPWLRKLCAVPDNQHAWRATRDRLAEGLRPAFAKAFLEVAETLEDDAPFLWGVEELLTTIPETVRPENPAWPDAYLRRIGSGLDLMRKIFNKRTRDARLIEWLARARTKRLISVEQETRLTQARAYLKAIDAGDARGLLNISLPDVPDEERGELLGQMLERFGDADLSRLDLCLESCRRDWLGAFEPGAAGLDRLAAPLSRLLAPYRDDPSAWIERLEHLLKSLKLLGDRPASAAAPRVGYEPDGLAAAILANSTRLDLQVGDPWPWRLRGAILRREDAWRSLRLDARRALLGAEPFDPPGAFTLWDDKLADAKRGTIPRLYELLLNSTNSDALAAIVKERARDFRSLDRPLSWWESARISGARDDMRDAFARLAPLAPLDQNSIQSIRDWMRSYRRVEPGEQGLAPLEQPGGWTKTQEIDFSHLSEFGLARWRVLEAITQFQVAPEGDLHRWRSFLKEHKTLPLNRLEIGDRHRFAAWMIDASRDYDQIPIDQFAYWLVDQGVTDAERLRRWSEELPESAEPRLLHQAGLADFIYKLKNEVLTRSREMKK